MSNGDFSLPAPEVNGKMWTKVLIRTSGDPLEWTWKHQARDGGGVQNGGVKLRREPKSGEFNQSVLAIGAQAQRMTH